MTTQVDTLIFGGGAAGLWLLDELLRRGSSAVLLEAGRLGQGQTIASQGIIHGGLKYTLQGLLTRSAAGIREMPELWRDCLAGRRQPDLRGTALRGDCCYLWRTESVKSRLGMIGAKFGLRVVPDEVPAEQRPAILRECPGTVARLDEQVICPAAFLSDLAERNRDCILRIDSRRGLAFQQDGTGTVRGVVLRDPATNRRLNLRAEQIVFTAGGGNARLRGEVGLGTAAMQKRPLHMVLLRGRLPRLNGHCVDGARTRATITSDCDAAGRTIWQVGGQIAEEGVARTSRQLMAHAARELSDVLPGLDLRGVEFATYRVDRAEAATPGGRRPDDVQVLSDGNVHTAWPTKLALVPQLADRLCALLLARQLPRGGRPQLPADWRRPLVASPPWETCANWQAFDAHTGTVKRAA